MFTCLFTTLAIDAVHKYAVGNLLRWLLKNTHSTKYRQIQFDIRNSKMDILMIILIKNFHVKMKLIWSVYRNDSVRKHHRWSSFSIIEIIIVYWIFEKKKVMQSLSCCFTPFMFEGYEENNEHSDEKWKLENESYKFFYQLIILITL